MLAFSGMSAIACFAVVTLAAAYDAVVRNAVWSFETLDEALYEAAGDGLCVVAAFLVVLGCSNGVKKVWGKPSRNSTLKSKKAKSEVNAQVSTKEAAVVLDEPSVAQQNEVSLRDDRTLPRAVIEGERDLLARAVGAGKADELPQLLHSALQRAAAKVTGASFQDVAQKYFLSSLKACAKHRCFGQALATWDQLSARLESPETCPCMWSILLYAAVEVGEFNRCEECFQFLLENKSVGINDFINMVRHYAHLQDELGLDGMLALLRQTSFTLDAQSRNRALAACVSTGAPALAEHLLTASETWAKADTVAFNTVMKGYAQERDAERCFWLHKELECCGLESSEVTYGILIDVCVESGNMTEAAEIIRKLRCEGDGLNVVHFTTFLKGLLNQGHAFAARDVLLEVIADNKMKPDLIACSLVVKALAEEGSIVAAMEVIDQMQASGVKPDTMMFHHLLGGHSCRCNSLPVIQEFFDVLVQRGLKPTTVTMSIITKAYARCEAWEAALDVLKAAPERFGFHPEPRVFCQLAQACCRSKHATLTIHIYAEALNAARASGQTLPSELHERFVVYCTSCGEGTPAELLRRQADRRRASR